MHHLPPSHHHDLLDLLGVEVCPYALSGSEMLYAAPVSAYALAMHCPLWACCCTGRSRVVITCMITCVLGVQDGNDWDDPPSEPHESIKAMALLYHQVSSLFFFSLDLDFDLDLEMENLTSIPIWIAISIVILILICFVLPVSVSLSLSSSLPPTLSLSLSSSSSPSPPSRALSL